MKKANYELRDKLVIFITRFISENGYSPTMREIMDGINEFNTLSHVDSYLKILVKNGSITRELGKSRTIKVIGYDKDKTIKELRGTIADLEKTIEQLEHKLRMQRTFSR